MRHSIWSLALLVTTGLCPFQPASFGAEPAAMIASSERGWSQFRGPRRDGVCDERGLLSAWPPSGPKELWSDAEGAPVVPTVLTASIAGICCQRVGTMGCRRLEGADTAEDEDEECPRLRKWPRGDRPGLG